MSTLSPTTKWSFVAVALSITTSSAVVGAVPPTSRYGDSCRLGSNENPRAEPPPFPIAFPSRAMNWA